MKIYAHNKNLTAEDLYLNELDCHIIDFSTHNYELGRRIERAAYAPAFEKFNVFILHNVNVDDTELTKFIKQEVEFVNSTMFSVGNSGLDRSGDALVEDKTKVNRNLFILCSENRCTSTPFKTKEELLEILK